MDLSLHGKTAVVVGASKGIGYAIARTFLDEGCRVAICSRNQADLEEAHRSLSLHGEVFSRTVDATNQTQLESFGRAGIDRFGAIHAWVNNVGGVGPRTGEYYAEEEVEAVTRLTFHSAVFGCQIAGSLMRHNPDGGAIINISSLAARCPTAGRSTLYGPLKAAVRHLAVTWAAEFARYNIRVNSVLPGFTATPAIDANIPTIEQERVEQRTLLRRMADPFEIARPVVFLCSDAASYITATSLEVSGGREVVLNPEIATL